MASPARSSSAPPWGIVLIRIYLGWLLLHAGWTKIASGVDASLVTDTAGRIASSPNWYRWFGQDVVLAHPGLFAHSIAWGEFLGGACLFLGLLVRPVGALVALMMVNFLYAGPPAQQHLVTLILVCALALSITSAGRRMGLDGALAGRMPAWLI